MYEIGVVDEFEAAHHLEGNFGPASRTHGHTYKVELSVRGDRLRDDGTLYDIGQLSQALREELGKLHYRDLSELDPFSGRNTTAEVVAEHLLKSLQRAIKPGGLRMIAIKVWESPGAYAAVEQALDLGAPR
jgi:6-pyruvoyltetrahydropterin/6-carboxytetrahydropterin synthase